MSFAQAAARPVSAPREFDEALVWVAVLLIGIGTVMVYSASIAIAEAGRFGASQPAYFLVRHCVALAISVAAAVCVFQLPMRLWQQAAPAKERLERL